MFKKFLIKAYILAKGKEKIDEDVKNKIHEELEEKEEEILEETIDKAVYEGKQVIDEKLKYLFKEFFIKIFINLFPILVGLVIYLLNPTDFTKKVLIVGYSISILIGLYEFIKFSVKSWKFISPIVRNYFELKRLNIYSPDMFKRYIKGYLQQKLLFDKLYDEILNEGKERIKEKLNRNEKYKNLKTAGYEYKDVYNDAEDLAQHIVYETHVPDIIWEELVKYIKYSLLTKWLFASILVISYIIIFRMFVLPIMISLL